MVRKALVWLCGIDWRRASRLRGEHECHWLRITRTRDAINNVEAYFEQHPGCSNRLPVLIS